MKKQSSTNRLWLIAMSGVTLQFIYLSICFSSMLSIASSDSLVDKLTSVTDVNDWLVLDDKVCESSTSSYRINLSNSLNNNFCIVFLWNSEIVKKVVIMTIMIITTTIIITIIMIIIVIIIIITGVAGLQYTVCYTTKNELPTKFFKGALKLTEIFRT